MALATSQERVNASMSWDSFLTVMHDMGFTEDPSAVGSSVRFDPPNSGDVPITFHKPHPDPTIHPMMLREFAKKLKKNYGWSEADLPRALQENIHPRADVNRRAFASLDETSAARMHQLFGASQRSMRWDSFLQLMRDMGFTEDPRAVGSSVRFDPPNSSDRPITFHKRASLCQCAFRLLTYLEPTRTQPSIR
ncbi:hypothetical protein FB451DRAFT_1211973 [Mycena latifolia]|nr:hypothetical protein FB451DRAFT_1211973 [Mycena latifolia]